jgi:hypothetical protein
VGRPGLISMLNNIKYVSEIVGAPAQPTEHVGLHSRPSRFERNTRAVCRLVVSGRWFQQCQTVLDSSMREEVGR